MTKAELKAARSALQQEFGLQLEPVLVLPKGSVPKTTSGKVQRKLCKKRYFGRGLPEPLLAAGYVPRFASPRRKGSATQAPPATFAELLERYGVEDVHTSLVDNGVDSLRLALLVREAQQLFGVTIQASDAASVPALRLGTSSAGVIAPMGAVPAAWTTPGPLQRQSVVDNSVYSIALRQEVDAGASDLSSEGADSLRSRGYSSPTQRDTQRHITAATLLAQTAACCFVLLVPVACMAVPAVVYTHLVEWRIATAGRDNGWLVDVLQRREVGLLALPMTWMLTYTAAVVILKWAIMCGRYRPGFHRQWSAYFTRWWIVDRLVAVWESFVGRHLQGTPYLTLVYWAMGGTSLPLSVRLDAFIREVDLFSAGSRAWVSGVVMCRTLSPQGMLLGRVHVGRGAHVASTDVLYPGVTVPSPTTADGSHATADWLQRMACPAVVAMCCGLGLWLAGLAVGESLDGPALLLSGAVVSCILMAAGIIGCRLMRLPLIVDRLYHTGAWLVSWWIDYSPLVPIPYHLMGAHLAWSVQVNRMSGTMLPSSAHGVTAGAHTLLTTALLRPSPGRPIKVGSCAVIGSGTWVLDDVSVGDGAAVGTLAVATRGTRVAAGAAFIGTRRSSNGGDGEAVMIRGRSVSVHCEPASFATICGALLARAGVHWAPAVACFWLVDRVVAAVNSRLAEATVPAMRVPTVTLLAVTLGAVCCVVMRAITLRLSVPRPTADQLRQPGAQIARLSLYSLHVACLGANYSHDFIVASVGTFIGGTWLWNAVLAAGGARFRSVCDAFILDSAICDGRLLSIGRGVVVDHATITGHRLEVGGMNMFLATVEDGCSLHPGSRVMGGDHLGPGIVLGARSKAFATQHRIVSSECGPYGVLMGVPALPVTGVVDSVGSRRAYKV